MGDRDRTACFDLFFRKVPDQGGYAIMAGLEQAIEYLENLHFTEDDIAYLRGRNMFDEGFLKYLEDFKFTGTIEAVAEGTMTAEECWARVMALEPFVTGG